MKKMNINSKNSSKHDSISHTNKTLRNSFILPAILTIILTIFLFIFFTEEHKKNIEVSEIGIETTAKYCGWDVSTHTDDDGHKSYSYYLKYEFRDERGLLRIHRESIGYSSPPYNKIGVQFEIKYHPSTFRVIKLPFNITADFFISNIGSFIAMVVSIVFVIIFIVYFLRAKADIELEKNGKIYTATFLSFEKYQSTHVSNNNKSGHYRIIYTWEENGAKKDGASNYVYKLEDAQVFEKLNTFEIYVLGDKTAIKFSKRQLEEFKEKEFEESPETLVIYKDDEETTTPTETNKTTEENVDTNTRFCIYCGAKIPSHANFCNKCGASQK